jgi:hypothetical protein
MIHIYRACLRESSHLSGSQSTFTPAPSRS